MKMLISSFYFATTQQTSERSSYTTTGAWGCYEDLKRRKYNKKRHITKHFFPLTLCFVCILQQYSTCVVYCIIHNVYSFRRNVFKKKNRVDVHGGIRGTGEDVGIYGRWWCGYITQIYQFYWHGWKKIKWRKILYNRQQTVRQIN